MSDIVSRGPTTAGSPVSGSSGMAAGLSRSAQRQLAQGLGKLSVDTILTVAAGQAEHGIALMRAQYQQELAILEEQARIAQAILHEQGRGQVGTVAEMEFGATAGAADTVARMYPVFAPQAIKIAEAQAIGATMALLGF